MQPTVLFDAPGPRGRARQRVFSIVFAVLVVAFLLWVLWKFNQGGQFETRIWERLTASNVLNALGEGLVKTLTAAAIAIVTSIALGFLLATARLSDHAWLRWPATIFVQFFRALPLLLLMIFLLGWVSLQFPEADTLTRGLFAVVGGLTIYNGAVLAEVFRAGILAVPKGQSEAAYAIGMRKTQVMTVVLAPQAVRFMLPAIISQCVVVLKDTSLGFIVVYPETVRQAKNIATYVGSSLMTYLVVAAIFIAINSLLSLLATRLERRLSRSRTSARAVQAVEEVLPAG
jgi:glutamate transport system permease protein